VLTMLLFWLVLTRALVTGIHDTSSLVIRTSARLSKPLVKAEEKSRKEMQLAHSALQ